MEPVIIEVAVNGAIGKESNPHVPVSAEEIAADALACLEAGAAVVHAHCNPMTGPPAEVAERYLAAFGPVWAARPDALVYPTLNVHDGVSLEHLRIMAGQGLRVGLFDPGCRNVGGLDADGLPAGERVYNASFAAIAEAMELHAACGLGPSLAIYEPGWLRTVMTWWRRGRLPRGVMLKLYLAEERGLSGAPFGLPVTDTGLAAYLELLGDCPLPWAVSAVGGDIGRSRVARRALERGGHLHLGIEFYGGDRTPSNVELVSEAVDLCRQSGRSVASCAEAARILDLPR